MLAEHTKCLKRGLICSRARLYGAPPSASIIVLGMPKFWGLAFSLVPCLLLFVGSAGVSAQPLGGAGTLKGSVRDASGAPAPSAEVELSNPIAGYSRRSRTGPDGAF